MSTGQSLKEQLFNAYVANLSAVGQQMEGWDLPPDHYLCPFCHALFGRETLSDPEALTVEHSIAGCVGGTRETATLTCKKCNNSAGTLFDADLATRFETEEFLQGISENSQRVWFNIGEGRTQADIKLKAGGKPFLQIVFCPHMAEAPLAKEAFRATKEAAGKPGATMTVQMRFNYRPHQARIALLRIAYLMMFRQFGYGYALSPGAHRVREQIMRPDEDILAPTVAIDMGAEAMKHSNTVGIVTQPPDHRAFLALLRLKTKARTLYKGVFMPAPGDAEASIYQRLNEGREAGKVPTITYTAFNYNSEGIINPEWATLAWDLWAEAQEGDQA